VERKIKIANKSGIKCILLLSCLYLFSCGQLPISEEEFNNTSWKNDKNGCQGERSKIVKNFEGIKDRLIGLGENQLRQLLGSPDQVQLLERSQKFYIYYIEKGAQCGDTGIEGKNYQIRFNSLNQVNEVSLTLPINN